MTKLATVGSCADQLRVIRRQLNGLLKEQRKRDFEIAELLHRVWSKRLYVGTYKTWTAYVDAEVGITANYASKYASLIEAGFSRADFERVGMSKLVQVFRVPIKQRPQVLAHAHEMTKRQIVAKAQEIRGVCRSRKATASITVTGPLAESIVRLADAMGTSPERYLELTLNAVMRRGKKAA